MLRIEEIYEFHYILKDHLGSWTTITDEDGRLEQELSYDAWGNLRDPDTWCVDATIRPMFDRGYTGHEHLPNLGLINMNGRMYDPVMSSFLSVDRYVQDPGNSQGFNRYAYCMYNPLRFTDPNGWHCGPPKSKSGLIQDYLADPCYITRQALRDAGLYDIEGGYGYASGHGTMCARWKEGDGSANQSSWSIQTESGGMSCGAWAVPSSWNNYETTESSNVYESNGGGYNQPGGLPTGGGGGAIGMGANNQSGNSEFTPSVVNNITTGAGIITGYQKSLWEKPKSRAQKAINQKKAYETQKALKAKGITKSVKEIKAGKIANLTKASNALGIVGLGISMLDPVINNEIRPSNVYEIGTSATCLALGVFVVGSPVGWIAGGVFLGAEVISYAFTGQSIGTHLDQNINWRSKVY